MTYAFNNTRRGLLAAAIVAPLAVVPSCQAAFAAEPIDAELIQTCDLAVSTYEQTSNPENEDPQIADLLREVDRLMLAAVAMPAFTVEGLAAKARLLKAENEIMNDAEKALSPVERLHQSLLSDLIRQGKRA